MALLKPILQSQTAFDATTLSTFTFNVPSGGDQVVSNRLTIINQTSGAIIYQATQTTFTYTHTLAANTLTNGVYYSAYVNTYNSSGTISADSNTIPFYCYTTPGYSFTNLPTGNIINNSSFDFEVTYTQTENELLNSYEYFLYDVQGVEISSSGVLYVGSTTPPPTVLNYTFSGFADNTIYKIQSTGITVNGTLISTPLTQINVQYSQPTIFATLQVTQNCDEGYVSLVSNITDIEGTSSPDPPIYIQNKEVDLTSSGSYVNWDNGQFDISNYWTLKIWGRNFTPNKTICTLSNTLNYSIIVNYFTDTTNMWWGVSVRPQSWSYGYYIESDHIPIATSTEQIFLWLRRVNNIYQIQIENLG